MSFTDIAELPKKIGLQVELRGWVRHNRGSGKIRFIELRDGTGSLQIVAGIQDVTEETFTMLSHLTQESVISVSGTVQASPKSLLGIELLANAAALIFKTEDYPITPKEHGTEFLMDRRHLWLRSPRQQAIMQIRHRIIRSVRDYFDDLNFTLVDAPIFTPNECEGSSTLFSTDYFGENAYLSQSGQLYMEAACEAMGRVYCFGPTFRAENSNTRRHLTEFWMVEPEVAFMELDAAMDLAEGLIKKIATEVLKHCEIQFKILERDTTLLNNLTQKPFARISYDQAVAILKAKGCEFQYGDDFGGADETVISSEFDVPVIVHRYPKSLKPFYMKKDPLNPSLALNMDVLAPEGYGEIIGGGQREENLQSLETAIQQQGLEASVLDWFLDLRRYGSVPHAGFGLGIERTVAWMCHLPHVRETIPFPRLPKRLKP